VFKEKTEKKLSTINVENFSVSRVGVLAHHPQTTHTEILNTL